MGEELVADLVGGPPASSKDDDVGQAAERALTGAEDGAVGEETCGREAGAGTKGCDDHGNTYDFR